MEKRKMERTKTKQLELLLKKENEFINKRKDRTLQERDRWNK